MDKKSIIKKCMGKGGLKGGPKKEPGVANKIVGGVKNFLINNPVGKASSALTGAYYNFKTNKAIENANRDIKTVREARGYDNAPNEADGGRARRVRFMSDLIKDRVKKTGK